MERIYLDHAATSSVHPKVVEKMVGILTDSFGNPSSIHSFGREARHILDEARTTIAGSIGAQFNEIIFTSGGTESDNYAIIGTAEARKDQGKHIITSKIEHHAVLHACEYLENKGFEITYLDVDQDGRINIEDVKSALRDDTILVTIMYGNNEVGSIQPIKEIGEVLRDHQAYFHTDAVQAYGVVKLNVEDLKVDMLSVSAHKINGPKGIGFLYIRNGVKIASRSHGGEQELKRRAGTENISSIAGLAEAV
ncbi:MAG: cysteine desulfurase family protein, partial [Heyndrickxia sp.]